MTLSQTRKNDSALDVANRQQWIVQHVEVARADCAEIRQQALLEHERQLNEPNERDARRHELRRDGSARGL